MIYENLSRERQLEFDADRDEIAMAREYASNAQLAYHVALDNSAVYYKGADEEESEIARDVYKQSRRQLFDLCWEFRIRWCCVDMTSSEDGGWGYN